MIKGAWSYLFSKFEEQLLLFFILRNIKKFFNFIYLKLYLNLSTIQK